MKLIKIASISLMFGFLFVANAVGIVGSTNDNSTNTNSTDLNDNSTNTNSTMLDISKGRSVISGDINISNLSDDIHSVWIVDDGNWKGYSPYQLVRDEIAQSYTLLEENIPAYKATMVFAMEDTQIELMLSNEPQDITRLYAQGLSLHAANGESFGVDDILCSQEGYGLGAVVKVMGDKPMLFVPEQMVEDIENFITIDQTDGYYVLCEKAKEE